MRDWLTVVPRLPGAVRSFVSALGADAPASDDRFSAIFEASPLPLFISAEDTGEILAVNAATESVSGWSAAELRGKSVLDFGHYQTPQDRAAQMAPLQQVPVISREVRLTVASGQELRLLAHSSRIALDGRACFLTAMTNITALGRMEEGLLFAQRMEVIGKLSGGVAHEFNNLLTVMQGHLDALADELGHGSPSYHRVETLRRSVAEATHITSGLLTFAGRNPAHATVVDLNVALADLATIVEGTLGETIEVEWRLSATPATVTIGQAHVAQVVLNLALNAREAMPNGGRLVISTERLSVPAGAEPVEPGPGHWVALRIADSGHGMPADVRRLVFEPFFTTKGPGQGPGLGLSICRGIAEQAGGHILVDSEPGRGTTMHFLLPWADAPIPVTPEPARPVPSAGRVVLLVEDESDVRDIVAEILRRAGHTVHATSGLASTLTLLATAPGPIDLLLTDLVLPGGNGLEVARRVRALYPDVPVLFMSGYSESVFSGGAAVEHLLQKPFTSRTLLDTIHNLLDGR
jgi:two-component system, cell cycle sensor histidine kinase and response regulator CckA